MQTLLITLSTLLTPAPPPRTVKQIYLPGVYYAQGNLSPATLYLHPDGSYGSIWGDSHYEGTWSRQGNKIQIRERYLGSSGSHHLWEIDLPNIQGTLFTLRLIHPLPQPFILNRKIYDDVYIDRKDKKGLH
jgi:hypothetical protein